MGSICHRSIESLGAVACRKVAFSRRLGSAVIYSYVVILGTGLIFVLIVLEGPCNRPLERSLSA